MYMYIIDTCGIVTKYIFSAFILWHLIYDPRLSLLKVNVIILSSFI